MELVTHTLSCSCWTSSARNVHRNTRAPSPRTRRRGRRPERRSRRGFDRELLPPGLAFLYLPFEHSEALADQEECCRRFEELQAEAPAGHAEFLAQSVEFARSHRDIIRRSGGSRTGTRSCGGTGRRGRRPSSRSPARRSEHGLSVDGSRPGSRRERSNCCQRGHAPGGRALLPTATGCALGGPWVMLEMHRDPYTGILMLGYDAETKACVATWPSRARLKKPPRLRREERPGWPCRSYPGRGSQGPSVNLASCSKECVSCPNHAGGELLNDVLHLLERESIFQTLGLEKTQALLIEITTLAQDEYDCNAGEILDEIGVRHELCFCCLKPARGSARALQGVRPGRVR